MPSGIITVESPIERTSRVMQIEAMFDVPPGERSAVTWDVDLPLDDDTWNIGLIVGPSGCGKTTIAKRFFGDSMIDHFEWPPTATVLDGFPESMGIKEITGLLTAVGFGSPPAWLRPFHVLSGGEQFRVTIARAMAETSGVVVVDEFTSVVDRRVAQVASHAIQKTVRRNKRQLIAVTCHYDVIEWLQPDWVYQPHTRDFARRRLRRHPPIDLAVHRVDRASWQVFKHHHYMSGSLACGGVHCVGGFIDDECVAFAAWKHFPNRTRKNIKMGHRLVVLPDYQGLGIGGRLDDWIGQYLYDKGFRYHNVVAHPAMIAYYNKSPRWVCLRSGRQRQVLSNRRVTSGSARGVGSLRRHQMELSSVRKTASFRYTPPVDQ